MTTRQQIKETIEKYLLDHKWVEPGQKIKESHEYENTYGMDSLDRVDLILELEREYSISIPDNAVERMDSVARTIDYIYFKLNIYDYEKS